MTPCSTPLRIILGEGLHIQLPCKTDPRRVNGPFDYQVGTGKGSRSSPQLSLDGPRFVPRLSPAGWSSAQLCPGVFVRRSGKPEERRQDPLHQIKIPTEKQSNKTPLRFGGSKLISCPRSRNVSLTPGLVVIAVATEALLHLSCECCPRKGLRCAFVPRARSGSCTSRERVEKAPREGAAHLSLRLSWRVRIAVHRQPLRVSSEVSPAGSWRLLPKPDALGKKLGFPPIPIRIDIYYGISFLL